MGWYYVTYLCGHEGRTNIIGPTKNRQWIADRRFSELCPECKEKEYLAECARANKAAAEAAKEMELPELTGSERQVPWQLKSGRILLKSIALMLWLLIL